MAADRQLFSSDDGKILIKGAAFTLTAIGSYLHEHRHEDGTTAKIAEKRIFNLVSNCTRLTTDHQSRPLQHHFKNALYDIGHACPKNEGYKNRILLEHPETLCNDAEDMRSTSGYAEAALKLATLVIDILLSITTKSKEEVKSMGKNTWAIHKHLFLMRLTSLEEWEELLLQLSGLCQNTVRSSSSDDKSQHVQALRKLYRQVDIDYLLDVKAEPV